MIHDLSISSPGFIIQKAKKTSVITCTDCGGWHTDSGAVFVLIAILKNSELIQAWICEICLLNRLHKRKLSGEVAER